VWALAATPSGLLIAAGGDGILRLWDAARGICIGSHRNAAGGAVHGLDLAAGSTLPDLGAAMAGGAALATANFADYSVSVVRLPPDVMAASMALAHDAGSLSRAQVSGAGFAGLLVRSAGAAAPAPAPPPPPTHSRSAHDSAEHDVLIEL
jgi:hypothetical protein